MCLIIAIIVVAVLVFCVDKLENVVDTLEDESTDSLFEPSEKRFHKKKE